MSKIKTRFLANILKEISKKLKLTEEQEKVLYHDFCKLISKFLPYDIVFSNPNACKYRKLK